MRTVPVHNALRRGLLLVSCLSVGSLPGCGGSPTEFKFPPRPAAVVLGQSNTLEIMTWNIEMFAKGDEATIDGVARIVDTLDVDIIAVQEIADTTEFRALIDALDGYAGLYEPGPCGDWCLKTGILYKESIVTVTEETNLFADPEYNYAFPRPPMQYSITASRSGHTFDFELIVLHLKAGGSQSDLDRRREAARLLKEYLDAEIAGGGEKDYILAGDWNDALTDPPEFSAFSIFLDSEDYQFLTAPLAGDNVNASYPSLLSFIDHILVSEDALAEYAGGSIHTERLDEVYSNYFTLISDHRPVMARFPVF